MKTALYFILFLTASLGLSEEVENSTQLEWWETTLLYQIYPRSFKDSNADGIGDLKGICEKLDYVKSIGVDAIWIQPFYKSPMFDMGYDVEDYKAVDPTFGTIEDFKELQKAVKDRGMKLILDYVPNHTSDKCEWFKLSERRIEPYTDYYIWKDPKRINDTHTTVPNNWKSIFPGSMWTWSDIRKQYYLHQFSAQQPDLNYRNPKVKKEMEGVLRFWLDLGADGFRVDAVSHLYEAAHFMDEPPSLNWDTFRIYTFEQPECVDLVKEWRAVLDEYSKKDGKPSLIITITRGPARDCSTRALTFGICGFCFYRDSRVYITGPSSEWGTSSYAKINSGMHLTEATVGPIAETATGDQCSGTAQKMQGLLHRRNPGYQSIRTTGTRM
ncbi:unnamed protein product [Bemisia tabaci]|uniref:alpha-glucosidase n=1 Tax=Bemisia tabaci TaxID=7038 RepID=A0A9P0A4D2_BEMTA|nr:unnamed protein product [Bemisia tabaci]